MSKIRINQEIHAEQLRVIGADGDQLGIISLHEALEAAEAAGADLVEISPNANPPVAKIIDRGKYQYQKMKEQHRSQQHARSTDLKQMRMSPKIGTNDLETKLRKIREFLKDGHKVKIFILFHGREMAHQELGHAMMARIVTQLDDEAVVEQPPQLAGRNLSMVIRSK